MRFSKLTSQLLTLAAVLAALPSQAAVTQTVKREFDQLGRLAKVIQADGSWEAYGYDPNGNRIYSFDQLDRVTRYEYDSFNRLVAITDPQRKVTKMAYDGRGNLVKVTDPRGLTTEYQYNGFNELVKQISPDTGTSTQTRETHGRVTSHTNAAGQTTQFKYDQFGRLIAQEHQGGPSWTFQRDSLGRLTEVTDAAGTTRYSYDGQSRLQSKTQQIGSLTQTVGYRWNAANRLAGITTPSGRVIDYTRQNGQIVAINLDGQPLLTQVVYQPLGGIQGWTWANGLHHTRLYDANGRLYRFESAGIIAKRLVFDSASNVEKLEDLQNTAGTQRFGYDRLDRLTSETATNRTDVYQYDDNGNRTSVTRNGTQTASQIDPASNRLTALASQTRTYTATGHLQSDGMRTFEYDGAERLVKVTTNGKTYEYQHNAWGERLVKPGVRFAYDESGRLLGEYTPDGKLIQETVWLGDLPIATIRPNPTSSSQTQVYYVHPDHLGSPRAVSDPISNQAVWRWDSDAFGQGAPEEDPDQDKQKFVYNLRFPGQYFDQETGLNYNFFRDYESETGRYIQSDPIGLQGGLNTYAYVGNAPLVNSDPTGLIPIETIWDFGNLVYDLATGNYVDAAADLAAMCTPYVPAGLPKLRNLPIPSNRTGTKAVKNNASAAAKEVPPIVYRGGKSNPSSLKLRPGEDALSFRDSLSNPYPKGERPVFPLGGDYIGIDTSKLPRGSVIPDDVPPGHVSIKGVTTEQIQDAVIVRGKFPK